MSNQSDYKRFIQPNMRIIGSFAALGGVVMGGFCLLLVKREQRRLSDLPFHNLAVSLLKSNSMAMELIGLPIEIDRVEVNPAINYVDPHGNGRLKIPLKGRKMTGDLYVWATLGQPKGWVVDRLEFKTADRKNPKTFIVYDKKVVRETQPKVNLNLED